MNQYEIMDEITKRNQDSIMNEIAKLEARLVVKKAAFDRDFNKLSVKEGVIQELEDDIARLGYKINAINNAKNNARHIVESVIE